MSQIKKILIANRGEIACRVIKTAKRLGIKTVAVYSDADAAALHVRAADEAIHIGPAPAIESYLLIDKIIDACKTSGADAVHPGYGFLSENPAFVRACDKAGIVFIGPKAESIEAMGLKDAAKKLMIAAGVPVTPGYHGDNQEPKHLKSKADAIGYPVLIKAVAGGGGKGMRKVETSETFTDALLSCQREAKSSFGDDRVLIEKYISSPRHIEVQIFGDSHGGAVHLYERDCSLQRRHQKVIEEAPAPGMTQDVRAAMTDAAVKAAQAVDYIGAGTVEFIVDGSGPLRTDGFWFMEMNTRLQVEHPVTEMITGLDLVEMQIRVAEGGKLPAQDDIHISGHAVEARLYAEDPVNDFLPSVGDLDILALPGIHRVDTGVEQGGTVSQYYDPMISKLIAHAGTREDAIAALDVMCRMTHVYPIKTNVRFLSRCLQHPDFITGDISTHFIATHFKALNDTTLSDDTRAALSEYILITPDTDHIFAQQSAWRINQPKRETFYKVVNGVVEALPLIPDVSETIISAREETPDGPVVFINGSPYLIQDRLAGATNALISHSVAAPMPGKIITVNVKAGQTVSAGDPLVIMEAMKMEMALEAPRDGIIAAVNFGVGDLVTDGDALIDLEH